MQQPYRAIAVILLYNFENGMKIWEGATTAGDHSSVGKYSKIHLLHLNKQVQLYCNACS